MRPILLALAAAMPLVGTAPVALADGMIPEPTVRTERVRTVRKRVVRRWVWGDCNCGRWAHPALLAYGLPGDVYGLPHHKAVPAPIMLRTYVVRTVKTRRVRSIRVRG